MFQNRREAGKLLALKLRKFQNQPGVILAVPRGGVPVACEVARELNIPLEVVLVKKLGHPENEEYAIGAVGLKDEFVIPHENVSGFYIERQIEKVRQRLMEMKRKFMGSREPEILKGRTVIIIDDGIATGTTMLATISIIKKSEPAKIIVAAPVVSQSAAMKLAPEVDELVALLIPETFYGVGRFYENFSQVTDEEVLFCINKLNPMKRAG